MSPNPPRPYRSALPCALLALAVAGLVYGALLQGVFFKTDGPYLTLNLAEGRCAHPYNAGYMPLLFGFAALLAPLGLTAFEVSGWFSVAGAALGVGLAQLAFARLGLRGRTLAFATLLVATTPPIAFFATVVEHHGPFLPFAAASFLLGVEFARRPGLLLALALGASTHLAYLVHGTGNLLPGLLFPLILAWRRGLPTWRRDLGLLALAGAIHLLSFVLLLEYELGGAVRGSEKLGAILGEGIGGPRGIAAIPRVVWRELLVPFAPLLIGALCAWWVGAGDRRRRRTELVATAVGALPYLAICVHLIAGEDERGAYLLPLAFPLAHVVAALPWPVPGAVAVLAALLAVSGIRGHETPILTEQQAWRTAALAEAGSRPLVLALGGTRDIAFALASLPEVERLIPGVAAANPKDAAVIGAVFDAWLAAQRAAGRVVLLTEGALEDLADPKLGAGAALLAHVRALPGARRVERGPFRGLRLGE
ncbi:MAG: hypothetical protein IT457_03850 [Planctomycetes bacterium]|nr:hypothetical protein [Planctomycetota bacterium]